MLHEYPFHPHQEFAALMKTDRFRDIYREAKDCWSVAMDLDTYSITEDYLAGALFEQLAFMYVGGLEKHQGLLSPQDTQISMEVLFGMAGHELKIFKSKFGLTGPYKDSTGYIPDGVRYHQGKLFVYEYSTTVNDPAYYQNKIRKIAWFQQFLGRHNFNFVSVNGYLVVLNNAFVPDDIYYNEYIEDVVRLPIQSEDMRGFGSWLCTNYRTTPDSPTLSELQADAQRIKGNEPWLLS